jgi:glycerate 2-kinase
VTSHESLRRDARSIFAAAVAAVDPGWCVGRALATMVPTGHRVWVLATGKAAAGMAGAALERLGALGLAPAGGLVITPSPAPALPPPLTSLAGDHPIPGPASFAAADALGRLVAAIGADDEVWVLVSGGTSSLIAAPVSGISADDFLALHRAVGRAGLPIDRLNLVRKRFARWGAGRLMAALPAAAVRVLCLSDVPGDAPADIGSGPCEPDPSTAAEVHEILASAGRLDLLPASLAERLDRAVWGDDPETPKPGDPAFARRSTVVVAGNGTARQAAAAKASALGYRPVLDDVVLRGEASEVGGRLAADLLALLPVDHPVAMIRGGETTVTMAEHHGVGGRSQELALAAAEVLAGRAESLALLAAGTDGRDGPTDAAGAIVDPDTWGRIGAAGAWSALRRHDAYPALAGAGALLHTGATGTNVMDLVIGLARPD